MTIVTVNGLIAVSPFDDKGLEKEIRNGMAIIKQKESLTKLRVIFSFASDPLHLEPGAEIWVRGDLFAQAWAKQILEIDGKKFILLPEQHVIAIEHGDNTSDLA